MNVDARTWTAPSLDLDIWCPKKYRLPSHTNLNEQINSTLFINKTKSDFSLKDRIKTRNSENCSIFPLIPNSIMSQLKSRKS